MGDGNFGRWAVEGRDFRRCGEWGVEFRGYKCMGCGVFSLTQGFLSDLILFCSVGRAGWAKNKYEGGLTKG